MLLVGQGPGLVAVEVERSQTDRSHLQGKTEHRPYPGRQGRNRKGDPPGLARIGQIGFEHRPVVRG